MAFTEAELQEAIRGSILELAKAMALTGSDLYPCLVRLKHFHEVLEYAKREPFERDREREEIRLRDERVRAEDGQRRYEEQKARQAELERNPDRYQPKWHEISGRRR